MSKENAFQKLDDEAVDQQQACSACNGKGYFKIETGDAWCRKCCPEQYADRRPVPLMEPTLLFDEETANNINWKACYPY